MLWIVFLPVSIRFDQSPVEHYLRTLQQELSANRRIWQLSAYVNDIHWMFFIQLVDMSTELNAVPEKKAGALPSAPFT